MDKISNKKDQLKQTQKQDYVTRSDVYVITFLAISVWVLFRTIPLFNRFISRYLSLNTVLGIGTTISLALLGIMIFGVLSQLLMIISTTQLSKKQELIQATYRSVIIVLGLMVIVEMLTTRLNMIGV